jgi:uncharacterized protein (TIGR02145 family)
MKTRATIIIVLIYINISAQIAGNGVTDIDGNYYNSVIIGGQEWMSQNLNVSRYRNGDVIPEITSQSEWNNATYGGWCYYMNDMNNGITYGKLYNWYAINDPRGLTPAGWHIPSYHFLNSTTDFFILMNFLGGDNIAGGKMKATTNEWLPPNTGATNISGFSALPGGIRTTVFLSLGQYGYWWAAPIEGGGSFSKTLAYNANAASINSPYNFYGLSVRAIKDMPLNNNSLQNSLFKIFPNPTSGNVNIQYHNFSGQFYSIEIYNLMGQLIFKEKVDKELYSFHFPNPSSAGIYLVKVYDSLDNLKQTQKIVLK